MPTLENIRWFKQQFASKIETATADLPFTVDMLTAIACQETGEIWGTIRKRGVPVERILQLCVGDVIYSSGGRRAFPADKKELLDWPRGNRMYEIAKQGLAEMAEFIPAYQKYVPRPERFCHGFGIFQYDLQFFKTDPDYFLNKDYEIFELSLGKCLLELKSKLVRIGLGNKTKLTDEEMAAVAIAYNTGGYKPALGLKQGYKSEGKYYGELVYQYIQTSRAVSVNMGVADAHEPGRGNSVVTPGNSFEAAGTVYKVDVESSALRLRKEPILDADPSSVIARLADGQLVKAISNQPVNGFLEVETDDELGNVRGFVSIDFIKPV